jgi:hypothetical protein
MKDYLDEGNIGPFLQTAIIFSLEEVKKGILKYISDNGKDCFQSKHFLLIEQDISCLVERSEYFRLTNQYFFPYTDFWPTEQFLQI